MSRIVWDKIGERFYETGLDRGVLYFPDASGIYKDGKAWNGLTNVNENPTGAEPTPFYADNIKYLNLMSVEELEATIEAYTYPDEFEQCDGSAEIATGVLIGQQNRKMFGLCYRTKLGNDEESDDYGYKLHLVYGALASPSSKDRQTINDTPEPVEFSWDITTTPVDVPGFKPTSKLIVESTKVDPDDLNLLETILYGDTNTEPRLPLPEEVMSIIGMSESDTPVLKLTVMPENPSYEALGEMVSSLQDNIVIGDNIIIGDLKLVENYTDFNNATGNFLALKFETIPSDAMLEVIVIGDVTENVKWADDTGNRHVVVQVTDKDTEVIRVKITKSESTAYRFFDLSGLTCVTE